MLTFPNGKRYIGVSASRTNTISYRWRDYRALRCSSQVRLYRAFMKYGVESVKFEILLSEGSFEDFWAAERRYIKEFKTQDSDYGYNISEGGKGGRTGIPITEATRAIMHDRFFGKPLAEDTRKKLSEAHKGLVVSEATKAKIRKAWDIKKANGWKPNITKEMQKKLHAGHLRWCEERRRMKENQ